MTQNPVHPVDGTIGVRARTPRPDPATSLDRIAGTDCDVIVIGAGVGGASAAAASARLGLRTLLVDRALFPRQKVCGCCLNAAALVSLSRLGHADIPAAAGAIPLDRIELRCGRARLGLPIPRGAAISRATLDYELASRAESSGAVFVDGCSATVEPAGDGQTPRRRVSLRPIGGGHDANSRPGPTNRHGVDAGLVIVADGLGGSALKHESHLEPRIAGNARIGAGCHLPPTATGASAFAPGTIHMAVGAGGYVGLVVLPGGTLDVAAAFDVNFVRARGGPGPAAAAVLRAAHMPTLPDLLLADWRGTPRLTRRRRRPADTRLICLGDAAGYVEPFTGEGMAWALSAAAELPGWLPAAVRAWDAQTARAWSATLRRITGVRQARCRWIAAALRRPRMLEALVRSVAAVPGLSRAAAWPILRGINATTRPAGAGT